MKLSESVSKKKRWLQLCTFILFCLLALARSAQAALQAQETALAASGKAYELNRDSQGKLWISDWQAGEIRAVNAASGAYTVYPVGGGPSDARSDGAGIAWWVDFNGNKLSRLTTGDNKITAWAIPGSTSLYSTGIDSSGDVWATDYYAAFLYKLDPDGNGLCSYAIPNFGVSEYLLMDGSRIWFGDSVNGRIVRLDGTTFTWWNLPTGSYPRDLALDGSGRVWWTDVNKGYVGRLDPAASSITTFTPPASASGSPQMLALADGKVWYSQQSPGRLAKLDPAVASGISATVTMSHTTVSPACGQLLPQAPVNITPSNGQASWSGKSYTTTIDQAGWSIYDMPVGAVPYGIAAAEQIWLVDQGRQVLAKVRPSSSIYLPMITKN